MWRWYLEPVKESTKHWKEIVETKDRRKPREYLNKSNIKISEILKRILKIWKDLLSQRLMKSHLSELVLKKYYY